MKTVLIRKIRFKHIIMARYITSILFFLLLSSVVDAQDDIIVKYSNSPMDKNLYEVLDFENITVAELYFSGECLRGKSYIITLEEFRDGNSIGTYCLFNGTEDTIFKIRENYETIKFYFKLSEAKLKMMIRGYFFTSKKKYRKLYSDSDLYAVKDFFGSNDEYKINLSNNNALFAIITPTVHLDGTSSYCEVVQSNIKPENLGKVYSIPHYFIVRISFI